MWNDVHCSSTVNVTAAFTTENVTCLRFLWRISLVTKGNLKSNSPQWEIRTTVNYQEKTDGAISMHGFTSHINSSPLQIKRFSVFFFFPLSKQEIKSLMLIVCSCLPSANSPLLNFSLQTSNELGERDYKANPVKKIIIIAFKAI